MKLIKFGHKVSAGGWRGGPGPRKGPKSPALSALPTAAGGPRRGLLLSLLRDPKPQPSSLSEADSQVFGERKKSLLFAFSGAKEGRN